MRFGHRGWLLDDAFTFYDRQTDSVWLQPTGKCIWGALQGQRLRAIPAVQTTWAIWRKLYPDTLVLEKPEHMIARYMIDSYAAYHARRGSEFGLAVFLDGRQKLYPLRKLRDRPVLYDRIGQRLVLVVYHPPSDTAMAYLAPPGDRGDRFELDQVTSSDVLLLDRSSGQTFSGLKGRPIPADLHAGTPGSDLTAQNGSAKWQDLQRRSAAQATALQPVTCTLFDTLNWYRHFPTSPVYRRF